MQRPNRKESTHLGRDSLGREIDRTSRRLPPTAPRLRVGAGEKTMESELHGMLSHQVLVGITLARQESLQTIVYFVCVNVETQ